MDNISTIDGMDLDTSTETNSGATTVAATSHTKPAAPGRAKPVKVKAERAARVDYLAEIDRQVTKAAEDARKRAVADYLPTAQRELEDAVAQSTDRRIRRAGEQLAALQRFATGGVVSAAPVKAKVAKPAATAVPAAEPKPDRARRTDEQLTTAAKSLVSYIGANPGSKASAIGKATGVDFGPSLPAFVARYVPGVNVVKSGDKSTATYSIGA